MSRLRRFGRPPAHHDAAGGLLELLGRDRGHVARPHGATDADDRGARSDQPAYATLGAALSTARAAGATAFVGHRVITSGRLAGMPEGHTIHRLARRHNSLFAGQVLRHSSPQGRFAASAQLLSATRLRRVEAYGKHLFYRFDAGRVVHVHLGLYGSFADGLQPAPEPRGALRWRVESDEAYADLRGPTACELIDEEAVGRILGRLGPDPLRKEASADEVWRRLSRRSVSVGAAVMDQAVLAGVGNVYRAEALHVNGISPLRPARTLSREEFDALWSTVVAMLRAGVRAGRIVTTRPEDRSRRSGPARQDDAHYVYRRTDLPCRRCGAAIVSSTIAARTAYWCPVCQPGSD